MVTLRLAWRNVLRHRRRSVITATALAGGVALSMAYLALIDGMWVKMFDLMVSKQIGHAQIHQPDFPKTRALFRVLDDADALEARVRAMPDVKATAARVYGYALLGVGEASSSGQLIGVTPKDEAAVRGLDADVVQGRYLGETATHEALLGVELAERLKAKVGDEVVAVTSAVDGSLGNDIYTVAGVVKTGSAPLDKSAVFLHVDDAQAIFGLEGQIHRSWSWPSAKMPSTS